MFWYNHLIFLSVCTCLYFPNTVYVEITFFNIKILFIKEVCCAKCLLRKYFQKFPVFFFCKTNLRTQSDQYIKTNKFKTIMYRTENIINLVIYSTRLMAVLESARLLLEKLNRLWHKQAVVWGNRRKCDT